MPWESLWQSWDTFGVHLERLGPQGVHVGVPLGARPDLGTSRALKCCKLPHRSAFLEFVAEETEVVSETLARTPPPTHAGGQDDGSYTNSLKLYRSHWNTGLVGNTIGAVYAISVLVFFLVS